MQSQSRAVPADSHVDDGRGGMGTADAGRYCTMPAVRPLLAGPTNTRKACEMAESLPASCLRSIVAGGDVSGHRAVLSGAGAKGPDALQV